MSFGKTKSMWAGILKLSFRLKLKINIYWELMFCKKKKTSLKKKLFQSLYNSRKLGTLSEFQTFMLLIFPKLQRCDIPEKNQLRIKFKLSNWLTFQQWQISLANTMAGVMCDGRGVQMGHQLMVMPVTDPSLQWRGTRLTVLPHCRHTPLTWRPLPPNQFCFF